MGRIKPPHIASVASTIPTPLWALLYGSGARSKPKLTAKNSGLGTSVSGPLLDVRVPLQILAVFNALALRNYWTRLRDHQRTD
jgi:hypothetical protein